MPTITFSLGNLYSILYIFLIYNVSWSLLWMPSLVKSATIIFSKLYALFKKSIVNDLSSCKPCVSSLVNRRQRLITETAIFISSWRKSLYLTQVAQEAGVHPDFLSMKRPEVCNSHFSPLDGMLVNLTVTSSSPPSISLGFLDKKHNKITRPGLEPRLLDPESSTLTLKPLPI